MGLSEVAAIDAQGSQLARIRLDEAPIGSSARQLDPAEAFDLGLFGKSPMRFQAATINHRRYITAIFCQVLVSVNMPERDIIPTRIRQRLEIDGHVTSQHNKTFAAPDRAGHTEVACQ